MLPAITSIVAKIMVLVDALLENFVTVASANLGGSCGINAIVGNLTPCGVELVDGLESLVYQLVALGANFLPALGVYTM